MFELELVRIGSIFLKSWIWAFTARLDLKWLSYDSKTDFQKIVFLTFFGFNNSNLVQVTVVGMLLAPEAF